MIGDLESCHWFADKFCVTHKQPEKECRKKAVDEWDRLRLKHEETLLQIDELKDDLADECDTSQKLSQKVIETERLIGELKAVIQKITFKSFDGHYNNTFSDGVPLEEECPDIVKAFDQQQTEKRINEVPEHEHQWGPPSGTATASAMVCRFCGAVRR